MARPAKYDTDKILESATALFWERGYRGVSISDLVKETGVLAGSLYGRFGNKEGLFIECIHHYAQKAAEAFSLAENEATPLDQLDAWYRYVIDRSVADCDRQGCFVVNSLLELSSESDRIAEVAKGYVAKTEVWIQQRLEGAKARGDLSPELDSKHLSVCLFGIVYAVRGMSRARESEERIRRYMDDTLAYLLDPWKIERSQA